MKRNSLTTALLAGLAGAAGLATTAHAVNINPDGLGQVLIYPYYTVENSQQTVISVVNTTNRVKAVKVRFLEGRNSKEVLDFNLYLSPFDVWTAAITGGATGPGNLATNDTSCTVPLNVNLPFVNYAYTGTNRDHPTAAAALLSSLERTREGHIEMIEMGLLQSGTASTQLAEEATHLATRIPLNCQALVNAWRSGGGWALNGQANIDLPSGGLFGAGAIVDVAAGTEAAYAADAVEGFYSNTTAPGALHASPGTTDPDLRDADNGGGIATSNVFANNGSAVLSEDYPVGLTVPNAVSTVFMHDAIYNEYNTEAGIGAASEWVITFPTKRYYVDVTLPADVILPFTDPFRDDGSSCDPISFTYYDREEQVPGVLPEDVIPSPPPPDPEILVPALCYEAQVLTFNQSQVANGTGDSSVLGSTYAFNIDLFAEDTSTTFDAGWAVIDFDSPLTAGEDNFLPATNRTYIGLPVTGFLASKFVNAAAQAGVLANYSGTFKHRASRAIS
jgi:hypothetical protein